MSVFESESDVYSVIGTFLERTMADADIGPRFVQADALIRLVYSEPASEVWIDARATRELPLVSTGPSDEQPTVEITMAADLGHRFWLGAVNIPAAMARGQVKSKGPMSKLLRLLPALRPAYASYRDFLKEEGRADLLAEA